MDQRIIIAPVVLIERIKQNIKVYIMKNSGAVYLQIDVRSMLKEQRQGIGSDIFVTNYTAPHSKCYDPQQQCSGPFHVPINAL